MKQFMQQIGQRATIYWLFIFLVLFLVLAAMGAQTAISQEDVKETNRQLKRIADSLEVISGQRGAWKLPR